MRHERHGTHSADRTKEKSVLRKLAASDTTVRRGCDEPNVWRLARQMRDEWRQRRYSRLKA